MVNKYVVAVSGGVDSMYLGTILAKKNQVAAFVHINHHTRSVENDYEQQLVEALGAKYNIDVFVFDYIHKMGNFQAKARKFRYACLLNVARQYSNKIALAHHLDDQLENCLVPAHLVKSNLMEYRSKIQDCYLYRPLIGISKASIYKRAKRMGVDYNEDASNRSPKYQRNRNRLSLNQMEIKLVARLGYILETNKLKLGSSDFQVFSLERENLHNQSTYYRLLKIYQLIKSNNSQASVKNRQLVNIDKLINKKKNSTYYVANCNELFIGYDKIYMLASDKTITTESSLLIGENIFNGISFYSDTNDGKIRTWQQGDTVELFKGHKKVSRIFIDNKVASHMRKQWPIVINKSGEIIWIPNIWRKSEVNR